MPITERKLSELRLIEEAQPRMRIDLEVVADYADLLKAGKDLPPIIVFGDVVADGFHRYLAHQSADRKTIRTVTQQGAEREAILYSCGANATHGLRRTSADKRKAVLKVLSDPEWGQWSSRRIAERCGVDHSTVDRLRNTLSGEIRQIERKVQRQGTEYTQKVSLRPDPKERPNNTVKRIVSAILLLSKSNADDFDRELDDSQRARLHDNLRKAITFLESLS